MGPGHHTKGRNVESEIVEIVEDADRRRTRTIQTEDLRSIGLAIRVQADPGRTRFRTVVAVTQKQDLISKDGAQQFEGRLVSDQVRRRTPFPLNISATTLVRAVVAWDRLPCRGLCLQACQMVFVQQIRDDQIPFQLDLPDSISQAQRRPVPIVDFDVIRLFHHHRTSTSISSNQLLPTPSCRREISTALASGGGGPVISSRS